MLNSLKKHLNFDHWFTWLNNNQDLPAHWKVLTVLGWSLLTLLLMLVLSAPWPWLAQGLPDRSEEIITITATFGAFVVPLVLTVMQNAFQSAPAFSARLYLFSRYAHSTELAQGFILLALIGLGIALAPTNPVTAVIAKWHLILVIFATTYLLWFIREAMRFANHYQQSDIILEYISKRPAAKIRTKKGTVYLLTTLIEEITLHATIASETDPYGQFSNLMDLIGSLVSISRRDAGDES